MTLLAPLPTQRAERLVYFGTPAMAVPPLEALVAAGFDIALVVTRIDKRRGRGSELLPSPVKTAALRLGLPVAHSVDAALAVGADLGVVVAFGQLIKPNVLGELAMVNLHFSLLPRWRGAAPVERALLAGDAVTGVCVMQLEEGLDTGPLLDVVEVPIGPRMSADELRAALVDVGATRLVEVLSAPLPVPVAQVGEPTYAAKLTPAEFVIDWSKDADEIDRLVRLGLAWSTFRGKRLKVLATEPVVVEVVDSADTAAFADHAGSAGMFVGARTVQCGTGQLTLHRVQPEGKPPMDAAAWANGAHPAIGESFDAPAPASVVEPSAVSVKP